MGLELRAVCLRAVWPRAFLPAVSWFLPQPAPGAPASSWPRLSHTLDLPDPSTKVRAFILALASDAMMVHQVPLSLPQSFPLATWAARFFTGESWLFPLPDPEAGLLGTHPTFPPLSP